MRILLYAFIIRAIQLGRAGNAAVHTETGVANMRGAYYTVNLFFYWNFPPRRGRSGIIYLPLNAHKDRFNIRRNHDNSSEYGSLSKNAQTPLNPPEPRFWAQKSSNKKTDTQY